MVAGHCNLHHRMKPTFTTPDVARNEVAPIRASELHQGVPWHDSESFGEVDVHRAVVARDQANGKLAVEEHHSGRTEIDGGLDVGREILHVVDDLSHQEGPRLARTAQLHDLEAGNDDAAGLELDEGDVVVQSGGRVAAFGEPAWGEFLAPDDERENERCCHAFLLQEGGELWS